MAFRQHYLKNLWNAIDLVCVLRNLHLSDLSDQQTIRVEIVEPATNPLSLVGA